MTLRKGFVERKTNETDIKIELNLDGDGIMQGSSGIGFMDHMLELFSRHGNIRLSIGVHGDYKVDDHHTVEDIGLCLGLAFQQALGDKKGIVRYASLALPMDEALVLCAVDISGRPGLYYDVGFSTEKIGQFDSQLIEVFWQAFANSAKITLHIRQLAGSNSHHIAEAVFKAAGRILKGAIKVEGREIPSSKGVL